MRVNATTLTPNFVYHVVMELANVQVYMDSLW